MNENVKTQFCRDNFYQKYFDNDCVVPKFSVRVVHTSTGGGNAGVVVWPPLVLGHSQLQANKSPTVGLQSSKAPGCPVSTMDLVQTPSGLSCISRGSASVGGGTGSQPVITDIGEYTYSEQEPDFASSSRAIHPQCSFYRRLICLSHDHEE